MKAEPMSLLRSPAFRHYFFGLACVVAGADFTHSTGSMLPLALGSAVAVMTMVSLVRELRTRAEARRNR
jgi:hypothetical protein